MTSANTHHGHHGHQHHEPAVQWDALDGVAGTGQLNQQNTQSLALQQKEHQEREERVARGGVFAATEDLEDPSRANDVANENLNDAFRNNGGAPNGKVLELASRATRGPGAGDSDSSSTGASMDSWADLGAADFTYKGVRNLTAFLDSLVDVNFDAGVSCANTNYVYPREPENI